MRGIFVIPVTPFDERGGLDLESLKKEINFCIESGVHGIVIPVGASEFFFLSDSERKKVIEATIQQVDGKIPVVAGIASSCKQLTVSFAMHANDAGADAVIALPPYITKADPVEVFDYYKAIADVVDVPIFIQNSKAPKGSAMSPGLISKLVGEIDKIEYVKEETPPSGPRITDIIRKCKNSLAGVFGGSGGRYMLPEKERDACGCMPACFVPELHVRIWELHEQGEKQKAWKLFEKLLPLINLRSVPQFSLSVVKKVLVRRGIIKTSYVREPGTHWLDEFDKEEFDRIWENIELLLRS